MQASDSLRTSRICGLGSRVTLTALAALAGLTGCSGAVGDDPMEQRLGSAPTTSAALPANGVQAGPAEVACEPASPRPTTRFFRLTHLQYDNSIRSLTGLADNPSREFPVDQNQAGFDRGIDLQVGEVLGQAYRTSAQTIAAKVVASGELYSKLVGCSPAADPDCARSFIAGFGRRVFRRALSEAEQAAYLALFAQAPALIDGPPAESDFQKGVQLVLEALLQSPNFLYRTELGEAAPGELVPLSGFELASKLSFSLLNQPPDDALLDAAAEGGLADPEAIAAEAARLLATPEARASLRDFHRQWLELETLPNKLAKDPLRYPSVTPALAPVLEEESLRFAEAVTFDERKGFASLITAPFAFVNQTTAPLYGVTGSFGEDLSRVALDPQQRAGLFTQLAFLANRAYTDQSSPIHRGVFVQRRVLCAEIPDPPANVPSPPALGPTQTTRQQVDTLTSVAPCSGCHHSLINPVGFGFESYDAVGQYRSEENGLPIDASGRLAGTRADAEGNAGFSDAISASQRIAESIEARRCYAATWTRYVFGRQEEPSEQCSIEALADKLESDDYTATDLLVDLTRSPAFRYRAGGAN